ncbi:MAG: hypothetical protein KDK36_20415, partial [Leptospiraceae bacterium]|nr:hypothetical protein [Leptospiraceae bacterium]
MLFGFLLFLLTSCNAIFSFPLQENGKSFSLSEKINIYNGLENWSNCSEISENTFDRTSWKKNPYTFFKPDTTQKNHWIHFKILNNLNEDKEFILPFLNDQFSEILICEYLDHTLKESKEGLNVPIDNLELNENFPLFKIVIPAGKEKVFYIKFDSNDIINQKLILYTLNDFLFLSKYFNFSEIILTLSYSILIIFTLYKYWKIKSKLYLG